jgi:hypothetical protein
MLAACLAVPASSAEPQPASGHGSTADPVSAAGPDRAAAPSKPGPGSKTAAIILHEGVPRVVFLGQPLSEFVAAFPTATRTPYAGQPEVVRLQVPGEGISALAMGLTPASMTIESIGFNFAGEYEGVKESKRRTAEGIGSGSTVNDLLGTYGRPAETAPEKRHGTLSPQVAPDRNAPVRYLYRSADATITTYFVVEGSQVTRMAMSRPASVERWILKRPGPTPPAAPPGPEHPPAQPGQP